MCLISVLPKGTVKFSDEVVSFIKSGAGSNNQGSGYAFKKAGSNLINVNKGFFNVDALIESYKNENLEVDDEVIIHHRIGTQGRIDDENCHPFIVSKDIEECVQIQTTTDKPVLAHNGMFRNLSKYDVIGYSDTFSFANGLMGIPQIMDLYLNNKTEFEKLFKDTISYSKIVFLLPDRDLMMTGDFQEENGYYHSNAGYRSWIKDVGGSSFEKKNTAGNFCQKKNEDTSTCLGITKSKISTTRSSEGVSSLTGEHIKINKVNKDNFIFRLRSNFFKPSVLSREEYYELIDISIDNFYTFAKIGGSKAKLYVLNDYEVHNNLQFIAKSRKHDMYKDYLYLITHHSRSKSAIKKLQKTYNTTHKQTNDTRVFCKNVGVPIYRESINLFLKYVGSPESSLVLVA